MHRLNRQLVPPLEDPEYLIRQQHRANRTADMGDAFTDAQQAAITQQVAATMAAERAQLMAAAQGEQEAPAAYMPYNRSGKPLVRKFETTQHGYEPAIVVPEITAAHFDLKPATIQTVQAQHSFSGLHSEDPNTFIGKFSAYCERIRYNGVPLETLKLMLFPYCLQGEARAWLECRKPKSITSWDQCVGQFLTKFFPPSRLAQLQDEIYTFKQKMGESVVAAWDRFNGLTRRCPNHGFDKTKLLGIFYRGLDKSNADRLDREAGGNFMHNVDEAGAFNLLNRME